MKEGFPAFWMGPVSFAFKVGCQQFGFDLGFFGSGGSPSVFGGCFLLVNALSSLCRSACGTSAWYMCPCFDARLACMVVNSAKIVSSPKAKVRL